MVESQGFIQLVVVRRASDQRLAADRCNAVSPACALLQLSRRRGINGHRGNLN